MIIIPIYIHFISMVWLIMHIIGINIVIARHEAISSFNSYWDCFVPRNDDTCRNNNAHQNDIITL